MAQGFGVRGLGKGFGSGVRVGARDGPGSRKPWYLRTALGADPGPSLAPTKSGTWYLGTKASWIQSGT
jgi:hypothetical protein